MLIYLRLKRLERLEGLERLKMLEKLERLFQPIAELRWLSETEAPKPEVRKVERVTVLDLLFC